MLQRVCVHQGKRHRFFIMEEQNVPTFVNVVKEAQRGDIFVAGPIEVFYDNKFFISTHVKVCFSLKMGFGVLAYGLKEADGVAIPGFINKHTDCREAVNKVGVKEFLYRAEMKFLEWLEDDVVSDDKLLDKVVIDKIDETLRKEGLQLTPSQILVLNKYIKE